MSAGNASRGARKGDGILARIYPLFSSSKGNAIFVGSALGGILIDAGVSCKRLTAAMARCGLPPDAVKAVFITHDHSDHVSGLKPLSRKIVAPVYMQPLTAASVRERGYIAESAEIREFDGTVTVGEYQVQAFATPHDTVQSCGYRITAPDGRICAVCTDLGYAAETVMQALAGCHLVLLEANYDPDLLRTGTYPPELKARIASDHGHLSNADSAALARQLVAGGTSHLVLGHLSQENNTPAHAEAAVTAGLAGFVRGKDYLLDIAAPETDGRMIAF